jgi:hypothetical protein
MAKDLRLVASGVRNRVLHLRQTEPLLTRLRAQGERLTRRLQRSQEGRGRLMDELGFFLGASSSPFEARDVPCHILAVAAQ